MKIPLQLGCCSFRWVCGNLEGKGCDVCPDDDSKGFVDCNVYILDKRFLRATLQEWMY